MKLICKHPDCDFSTDSQRSFIYHIKNTHGIKDLKEYYLTYINNNVPMCIVCNTNEASFDSRRFKFYQVCSNKTCVSKYAHSVSARSIKEKYGVDNISQISEVKDKVAKTKEERYGSPTYNNMEKNKQTCIERYGVDNGSKSEGARKKISEKSNERNEIKQNEYYKQIKNNF